jgi:hypothetical protein
MYLFDQISVTEVQAVKGAYTKNARADIEIA